MNPGALLGRLLSISGRKRSGYWSSSVHPEYYYGVWLKHLVLLNAHGMRAIPGWIAEFGPGDSLGVGLCALLCGASKYRGFDTANFIEPARDQAMLARLAELFSARQPRPRKGWPDFDAHLPATLFPDHILPESRMRETLDPARVARLSADIERLQAGDASASMELTAPWQHRCDDFEPQFDLVMSHTVLQYLPDLRTYFTNCARLLKPGGWMSHQVDFSSMGMTRVWNGHLAYDDIFWRLLTRNQRWFPTRKLLSEYLREIETSGLQLVHIERHCTAGGLTRDQLATAFRCASDEDIRCSGVYMIACKPL